MQTLFTYAAAKPLAVAASDETKCLYLNYDAPTLEEKLVPNTNCWAYGIDLSCASPWNDWRGRQVAGTAISSRHVLFAKHFVRGSGAMYFVDADGRICTNHLVSVANHPAPDVDIAVGILLYDLPASIHPAKILPENYREFIMEGTHLPVLTLDQDEHAIVHDMQISEDGMTVTGIGGQSVGRLGFYEAVISGDSGNPRFLVVSNDVVLLHAMHTGGYGSGPFVSAYKHDIEFLMDALSVGQGLETNVYRIAEIDLGGFDR